MADTDAPDGAPDVDPSSVTDRAGLAAALGALRDRRALSVRDVARLSRLPLATVAGYLAGRHLPQPATLDQFQRVLRVLGVPDADQGAWLDVVSRLRRAPGPRPASATAPYRGLAPYGVDDAALFVGREADAAALAARVLDGPPTPIVVLGPSGVGKSSLLGAGLVASLRSAGHPAVVVAPAAPDLLDAIGEATAELDALAAAQDAGPRVLVVDQLEALVLGDAAQPVRAVLDRLAALHADGTRVVLGLRADAFERALTYEDLAAWLARPALLRPLSRRDLRRVVLEPAGRVGVDVDDALVDAVLDEAAPASARGGAAAPDDPVDSGVLPLVSHALYATWSASSGRRLTLAQYRAVGGLAGAIAQTAEDAIADLPADELAVVRRVLLALVHVRDAHVTARSIDLKAFGEAERRTLSTLAGARLLTVDRGQVRLAHEALLVAWPRLRAWIDDDRQVLRARSRLAEAARQWGESGWHDDALYRGVQLDAAVSAGLGGQALTAEEHAFLDASVAEQARQARDRRRSVRRLRTLAAGLSVLTVATGALATTAVVQGRAAARDRDVAVSRQLAVSADAMLATDPTLAGDLAVAAHATADTVEARSALMSATGVGVGSRLAGAAGLVNAVAVSPDGTFVAAATAASTVDLWTVADDGSLDHVAGLPVEDTALYALAFTEDGVLVAGGDSGRLSAWDLGDGRPEALPSAGDAADGTVYDIAVVGDGSLVAAAVSDGSVHLWHLAADSLAAGATLAGASGTSAQAVAVDPAGTTLAVAGSSGAVTLWDLADPDAPTPIGTPVDVGGVQVNVLAWAPDGATLAAGTTAGVVARLDVADPADPVALPELSGPASWVNDLAFTSDGAALAAASSDQQVWVWDTATGGVAARYATPTTLLAARWSPSGEVLYGSGADGVVRAWPFPGSVLGGFASIPGQGAFGSLDGRAVLVTATTDGIRTWDARDPAHVREIGRGAAPADARLDGAVDISPLGYVVAGDTTGGIHVWDVSDPARPELATSLRAHTDWVDTVTFDASGTRLAASSDDASVTLWDFADGVPDAPVGRLDDLGGQVYVVAYSGDASLLAASILDGTVVLVDVSDPAHPAPLGSPMSGPVGYVYSTAMTPDGRTVAASGNDGTVWLWDTSDPAATVPLGAPLHWGDGYGTNTAFSADGTRLAVARTDGTVRVWDVTDPAHPRRWATLSGADGTVYGVEFSPDGSHLSGAAADRTVRLWDVTVDGSVARACEADGRGLAMTDEEWEWLAGDAPRPAVCG